MRLRKGEESSLILSFFSDKKGKLHIHRSDHVHLRNRGSDLGVAPGAVAGNVVVIDAVQEEFRAQQQRGWRMALFLAGMR